MAFNTMNGVNFAKSKQQSVGMAGTSPYGSASFAGPASGGTGAGGMTGGAGMPIIGSGQNQGSSYTRGAGMMAGGMTGMAGNAIQNMNSQSNANGQGVTPGVVGPSAVNPQMQGPSAADIQAEMQRRNVGAQLGADPRNAALAGYMMSK